MLADALATGESHLDVTSRGLHKRVAGDAPPRSFGVCCRLMLRMMIPGDSILSGPTSHNGSSLLVRYRLPR